MHRRIKLLLTLSLFVLLISAWGAKDVKSIAEEIAAIEAPVGTITKIDCPLKLSGETEDETYACGAYTVPLDYDNPGGNTLNLTHVVLKAENANPLPVRTATPHIATLSIRPTPWWTGSLPSPSRPATRPLARMSSSNS